MTYAEAKNNGYKPADQAYFRGYVSRKVNADYQIVKVAGGSRNGQLYVELPCWDSTNYAIRQYLVKTN